MVLESPNRGCSHNGLRRTQNNLPSRFRDLPEKCLGIIQSSKYKDVVWFWGTSWIVKCNQTVDLPVSTRKKQKKRSRDGLTITTDDGFIDDNDDDERDDEDNLVGGETEDADISGVDLTDIEGIVSANIASNINGTKDGEHSRKSKSKVEPFVFIEKYNPILFADFIGKHELVVVERPFSMVKMDKKPFGLSYYFLTCSSLCPFRTYPLYHIVIFIYHIEYI